MLAVLGQVISWLVGWKISGDLSSNACICSPDNPVHLSLEKWKGRDGCSVGLFTDWLVGWLACCLVGLKVDWLAG